MTALDGRVRRIDIPNRHLLVITLEHRAFVVGLGRRAGGFGFVEERPKKPKNPNESRAGTGGLTGLSSKLRHHLDDARLVGVTSFGLHLHRLDFVQGPHELTLWIDNDPHDARLLLAGASGEPLVTHAKSPFEIVLDAPHSPEVLEDARPLVDKTFELDMDERIVALGRAIRAHLARLSRKVESIRKDLVACETADGLRRDATALVSFAPRQARGPSTLTLADPFSTDDSASVMIVLPIGMSAHERAQQLFDRAKKLEQGAHIARARLEQTSHDLAAARELLAKLAALSPATPEAFDALVIAARALRIRDLAQAVAPSRKPVARRKPYRTFRGSTEGLIHVGKTARDNDELTLHVARPHDLWLHARGTAGAHVVVPLAKNQSCPSELLIDAAHLAAHFSDQRGETLVEIDCVDKRYVRKPKGSPPGKVMIQQAKTLTLRLDPLRLQRLLNKEEL